MCVIDWIYKSKNLQITIADTFQQLKKKNKNRTHWWKSKSSLKPRKRHLKLQVQLREPVHENFFGLNQAMSLWKIELYISTNFMIRHIIKCMETQRRCGNYQFLKGSLSLTIERNLFYLKITKCTIIYFKVKQKLTFVFLTYMFRTVSLKRKTFLYHLFSCSNHTF